ncbi:DUF4214 domain-containing protein [Rugamonas sp. CCM 8940]|uniref:DUF4214 domain-containing protein n=1 Tax=Rugamonas sp. CCM 8940 TaxID=2765359 RepID=UPI003615883F
MHALIDSFAVSAESAALYPGATTTFINALYQNVFGRAPDAGGLAFWSHAIDSGGLSRANASLSVMAGALDNKTAQGVLDAKLVNNKLIVASGFTLMIDTPQEIAGYGSAAAAASVRAMLGAVTASNRPDRLSDDHRRHPEVDDGAGQGHGQCRVRDPIVHVDLIGIGHQPWEQTLV